MNSLDVFYNHFKLFEGDIPTMYLDGPGNVTIGVGCLLSNVKEAQELPFRDYMHSMLATPKEIENEFNAVKKLLPNKLPIYYINHGTIYLSVPDRKSVFYNRIEQLRTDLGRAVPLSSYSDAIQLVLFDFAFNLGISGFVSKFPKFIAAIKEGDYERAAIESTRLGISQERNDWAKKELLGLLNETTV